MSNAKELPIFNANHEIKYPRIVRSQIGNRQLKITQVCLV